MTVYTASAANKAAVNAAIGEQAVAVPYYDANGNPVGFLADWANPPAGTDAKVTGAGGQVFATLTAALSSLNAALDPIEARRAALETKAIQALTANATARTQIAAFIATAKPGTAAAQASAAYDALKQLAAVVDTNVRELTILIRHTLDLLDDISDT